MRGAGENVANLCAVALAKAYVKMLPSPIPISNEWSGNMKNEIVLFEAKDGWSECCKICIGLSARSFEFLAQRRRGAEEVRYDRE